VVSGAELIDLFRADGLAEYPYIFQPFADSDYMGVGKVLASRSRLFRPYFHRSGHRNITALVRKNLASSPHQQSTIAYVWSEGKAPCIPNLGTRWKWVISLTLRLSYFRGMGVWYALRQEAGCVPDLLAARSSQITISLPRNEMTTFNAYLSIPDLFEICWVVLELKHVNRKN
jgi:hypothetical protein